MARQPRKWTMAEDQILKGEVSMQLPDIKDWCRIAAALPGRTNKDCRKRWHNAVAGGLRKGQWSKAEDNLLTSGISRHGQRWTLVADVVGSRSADQCAKRWQQSLNPDLDRSEWKPEENDLLLKSVQQFGRHWKDIQQTHFPGRSKNCIKNRFTVLLRRSQNQGLGLSTFSETPLTAYRPDFDPEDESGADSDGMDDDSGVSVGFDRSPRTPSFERCSSWAVDDASMSWTPQESVCASIDGYDLASLTSTPSDTAFGQLDFGAANQWNWQDQMLDASLFPGMDAAAAYPQSGYATSESPYAGSSFGGGMMYGTPPSMSNYPPGAMANCNRYACPDSVPDSKGVKVTVRFSRPNSAMMSSLMKLAIDNEAPFRVVRN